MPGLFFLEARLKGGFCFFGVVRFGQPASAGGLPHRLGTAQFSNIIRELQENKVPFIPLVESSHPMRVILRMDTKILYLILILLEMEL
jgi:hypothetical protein